MQETRTFKDVIFRAILYLWGLTIVFPLGWILFESFKTNPEFFENIWALPEKIQFDNYIRAWNEYNFGQAFSNTMYYVGGSLILGLLFTTLTAYALTRIKFKGRKAIWSIIMISLFLPGINAIVPQFVVMRDLGLTNSLTGLIILSSLGETVFYLMILSGFMKGIPKEVEESAFLDGASHWKVFWKIIVPLSMPGIVTVAIFKFIDFYNAFLSPLIYLSDPSKYTIGLQMYQANKLMEYSADWVTLFAGMIIAMIPSILVFIFFQRWIVKGATFGSVKG